LLALLLTTVDALLLVAPLLLLLPPLLLLLFVLGGRIALVAFLVVVGTWDWAGGLGMGEVRLEWVTKSANLSTKLLPRPLLLVLRLVMLLLQRVNKLYL